MGDLPASRRCNLKAAQEGASRRLTMSLLFSSLGTMVKMGRWPAKRGTSPREQQGHNLSRQTPAHNWSGGLRRAAVPPAGRRARQPHNPRAPRALIGCRPAPAPPALPRARRPQPPLPFSPSFDPFPVATRCVLLSASRVTS